MDLLGIVENQIPRGPRAGYFEGRDGHQLRFARWRPSVDTCRGTVCLFTGRGEFIEKYFETIQDLRRRGFAVATMDWRGQGRSKPRGPHAHKGHIASFRLFDDDLRTFMDQGIMPGSPGW
jgi:lysophospholipase